MVAAIALLFYDTALKLGDEVNHLWFAPWSIAKLLYLIIRYLAFVDASLIMFYEFHPDNSAQECHLLYQVAMWFMTAGIIFCQFVLIVRTYAIWARNFAVGLYLSIFQVAAIIISIIFCNKSAKELIFIPSPIPRVVPCIPLQESNISLYAFACVAIFDFNILTLTMLKGYSHYRKSSTPLVRTLYRDGIIYFVVLFTVSLTNVILMRVMNNSPYFYMLTEPQRVLHTVLITRLILNVRVAAEKPTIEDSGLEMRPPFPSDGGKTRLFSTLNFRSPFDSTLGIFSHGSVIGETSRDEIMVSDRTWRKV
ncbi:hypothetical protein SCHPADRAFT_634053 [Schizopora paradoxa]|uniref:DUF6533 domain-containing protein n=1 Tax=Schizopora paradoxa TaxID=27342 RepID=A0A0H2RSE9_9AGAM|nr:hypothetical protein SCHPADRAFT_634053 [Schizopora paradoxa]